MRFADIKTALFLAKGSVWRGNRAVLLLTPLIIGLAMVNVLFFSGLFAGLYETVDRQITETLFGNILLEPPLDHTYIVSPDIKMAKINSLPGVVATSQHLKTGALFSFDKDHDNLNVKHGQYSVFSVEPEQEARVTSIASKIIAGRYLAASDRDSIVLGVEAAGGPQSIYPRISLGGVGVGDSVRVEYPSGTARSYTVIGIYKTGSDISDAMAFVTHKEMESVLNVRDLASEILIKTKPGYTEKSIINQIRQAGITEDQLTPFMEFINYTGATKRVFDFLKIVTSLVSMIVVTITVFIVMFIHVTNKRKQLGILRAIGVSDGTIILSYIFQALFYAACGVGIGLIIIYGVVVPYTRVYPLDSGFGLIRLLVDSGDAMRGMMIIMITNILAGYIPARWAMRSPIITSIWGV